jgi:preprotein translocase subunit SecD
MRLRFCLFVVLLLGACSGFGSRPEFLSVQWEADGASKNVRFCELIGTGQEIPLDPEILVGLSHIRSARVVREEGAPTYSVMVGLTSEGQSRLKDLSSQHIGRRLAIVLDDEVVGLATVMRPLDAGELPLMPTADESAARDLAERINDRLGLS